MLTADFDGKNILTESTQSIEKIDTIRESLEAIQLNEDEDEESQNKLHMTFELLHHLTSQSDITWNKDDEKSKLSTDSVISAQMSE